MLAWLGQFDPNDQAIAFAMLRAMRLVSGDEFTKGMRTRLLEAAEGVEGAVALYAEREVLPKSKKVPPDPLFVQPEDRPRRAVGKKALIVLPDEDVGSEGLIAQLITELTRQYPEKFVNHPGPNLLRAPEKAKGKKRTPAAPLIRKFVLVTDLIGSGNQASRYLEAAWRVDTIKGLCSMRAGLSFDVVAFATTVTGADQVKSHAVQPVLRTVCECPTIDTEFQSAEANQIKDLCRRCNPIGAQWALGFENTGALLAFAHGAPNNTPAVLWANNASSWAALFPQRVTAGSREVFGSAIDADAVSDRLASMRQKRLTPGVDWSKAPPGALEQYLVLAALSNPPRNVATVARRSGLTLLEVEKYIAEARKYQWTDKELRLTDSGQAQLAAAKHARERISVPEPSPMYYPSSLRAPM